MEKKITVYTFGSFKTFRTPEEPSIWDHVKGTHFGVWLTTHKLEEGMEIIRNENMKGPYYITTEEMDINKYISQHCEELTDEEIKELGHVCDGTLAYDGECEYCMVCNRIKR